MAEQQSMVSEQSMWFVIVLVIGVIFMFIFVAFVVAQGPDSFIWEFVRSTFYDLMYYFGGPRIVEV